MKKVGLYFGSFNPIHVGHLIIANYMTAFAEMDEIWFIVSPQSPFKNKDVLVDQNHRLKMVQLATFDNEKFIVSDVEFNMPKPSYTIDTLEVLSSEYKDCEFHIIMGEDNLLDLHRWKGFEEIIRNYPILVYPRNLQDQESPRIKKDQLPDNLSPADITICDAPLLMISSTFVRDSILNRKDVRYLIPDSVIQYISNNFFYEE